LARPDPDTSHHLKALVAQLTRRRPALLSTWGERVRADPSLGSGRVLSRAELNDHIPSLLASFEQDLLQAHMPPDAAEVTAAKAEAHGMHRWQQGYDPREVARELGLLNECMCAELDACAEADSSLPRAVMATARQCWARTFTVAVGESTAQFFELQQLEAASHIEELDGALDDLLELERLRAELWQQAAHDLRGNVGAVANVTAGLSLEALPAAARERFLTLLQRNVSGLNHLLNDVTSLARLQAGEEQREIGEFDAAALIHGLCQALNGQAEERGLYLRADGPPQLRVQGDAVKVRRIAQNLLLNALAYTPEGGVDVTWGADPDSEGKRWVLSLRDTGPGLHSGAEAPLAAALTQATALAGEEPDADRPEGEAAPASRGATPVASKPRGAARGPGEGLGLTIVKRLCDLLDASLEVESQVGVGTRFRILLPISYPEPIARPGSPGRG
jgi:signal transduction histidine kinase